eukprot:COSAG01_NODE_11963_length_1826_cov_1.060799_2_plen_180_part_00
MTEIYLCGVCSCHEITRSATARVSFLQVPRQAENKRYESAMEACERLAAAEGGGSVAERPAAALQIITERIRGVGQPPQPAGVSAAAAGGPGPGPSEIVEGSRVGAAAASDVAAAAAVASANVQHVAAFLGSEAARTPAELASSAPPDPRLPVRTLLACCSPRLTTGAGGDNDRTNVGS